jgi:hypothetical protein
MGFTVACMPCTESPAPDDPSSSYSTLYNTDVISKADTAFSDISFTSCALPVEEMSSFFDWGP